MEELLVMSAKERERLKIFERVKNGELQQALHKKSFGFAAAASPPDVRQG